MSFSWEAGTFSIVTWWWLVPLGCMLLCLGMGLWSRRRLGGANLCCGPRLSTKGLVENGKEFHDRKSDGGSVQRREGGFMDERVKRLVAIGASIGANCQSCVEFHIGKALELGIDRRDSEAYVDFVFAERAAVVDADGEAELTPEQAARLTRE